MNLDDKIYDEIERYLQGLMDAETKAAFEQRIESDNELSDLVTIFKMMPGYFSDQGVPDSTFEADQPRAKAYLKAYLSEDVKRLQDDLQNFAQRRDQATPEQTQTTFNMWRTMRVAAMVVILFGAAFFLFRPGDQQDLYSQYAQHEELVLNVRGDSDELSQNSESLFNAGKYEEAIPAMKALKASLSETDYNLELALGIALMESEEYDEAQAQFDAIIQSDALVDVDAIYNSGLAYLKAEEPEKALDRFRQIRSANADYKYPSMDKLMQKLEKKTQK